MASINPYRCSECSGPMITVTSGHVCIKGHGKIQPGAIPAHDRKATKEVKVLGEKPTRIPWCPSCLGPCEMPVVEKQKVRHVTALVPDFVPCTARVGMRECGISAVSGVSPDGRRVSKPRCREHARKMGVSG